ncbi:MAG: glycosyltransferase family 2 protein [Elusimicrobia bacterium]|nr:glycosyltransferase family 2 protein [Elusimicrobiota bacterium]
MNPEVSIIIVNWNTRDYLKQCLQAIRDNVKDTIYEVIVVDNNSQDGSVDMVRNDFPEVKLIKNTTNLGFAKANNQAIILSKGEYVLILNPDTIVFSKVIEDMVKFMDKHPKAGACGPKLLDGNGKVVFPGVFFPTLKEGFGRDTILRKIFPALFSDDREKRFDCDKIQKVERLYGCCMLVRRKTIEQVGLMDERMFLSFEEPEWCLRMQKNWEIYYFPQVQIIHYGAQSKLQINQLEAYLHARRSEYVFYRKRYGIIPVLFLRFLVAVSSVFGLVKWLWIGLIKENTEIYQKISFYKALLEVSSGIRKKYKT